MTLYELGLEYLASRRLACGRIEQLRSQLKHAGGNEEREYLTARIGALMLEAAQAGKTAEYLMLYYGDRK